MIVSANAKNTAFLERYLGVDFKANKKMPYKIYNVRITNLKYNISNAEVDTIAYKERIDNKKYDIHFMLKDDQDVNVYLGGIKEQLKNEIVEAFYCRNTKYNTIHYKKPDETKLYFDEGIIHEDEDEDENINGNNNDDDDDDEYKQKSTPTHEPIIFSFATVPNQNRRNIPYLQELLIWDCEFKVDFDIEVTPVNDELSYKDNLINKYEI